MEPKVKFIRDMDVCVFVDRDGKDDRRDKVEKILSQYFKDHKLEAPEAFTCLPLETIFPIEPQEYVCKLVFKDPNLGRWDKEKGRGYDSGLTVRRSYGMGGYWDPTPGVMEEKVARKTDESLCRYYKDCQEMHQTAPLQNESVEDVMRPDLIQFCELIFEETQKRRLTC